MQERMDDVQLDRFVNALYQNDVYTVQSYKTLNYTGNNRYKNDSLNKAISWVLDRNMLSILITNGYDVNLHGQQSIFNKALMLKDSELIKLCLQKRGDISKIMLDRDKEKIKLCIKSDHELFASNTYNYIFCNNQINSKNLELLKLFLNCGGNVHMFGGHYIMATRDKEIIELSLKYEKDAYKRQLFVNSALQYIFSNNQTKSVDLELLKLFLNCGGNAQSVYVDQIMATRDKEIIELWLKNERDANNRQMLVNRALQYIFGGNETKSVDWELLKLFLNCGGNVQSAYVDHIMLSKNKEIIELCLKSEQDAIKRQSLVNTALQFMFNGNQIHSVDCELLKLCLNNGGNAQCVIGNVMLTKNKEIIELCLKSEQDAIKRQSLVNSALQFMFNRNQIHSVDCELLKLCLINGGDAQCVIGNVMLTKNKEIIELCLKSEQNADKLQSLATTTLRYILDGNQDQLMDCEIIKFCLYNRGSVQDNDVGNIMRKGDKEIIELWLKSEQDEKKLKLLVDSALQYIFDGSKKYDLVEITELLSANGANMDVVYQCNRYSGNGAHTLIIEACIQGNISLVRTLLTDCAADVNCVTADNGPLHAAIKSISIDIVRYLLDQPKIDVNQQILSTFETPLHVASKLGDVRFVKMLLDKGANKKIYYLKGQYPCDVVHESVGKYYHKILAVDTLVSVEEKLIIYEHKLMQSLEDRLPQLDLKISELTEKYENIVTRMQKRIDEMCEKLQENEKKMLYMESQQTRLTNRIKQRYKPT